MIYLDWIPQMA